MREWNNLVWRAYRDGLGDCFPNLLILDKATMYVNPLILKEIEKSDTEVKLIPSDMTRILQPLDAAISKPFKEYMRRKFIDNSALINLKIQRILYSKALTN